jgi:hypothetical protein
VSCLGTSNYAISAMNLLSVTWYSFLENGRMVQILRVERLGNSLQTGLYSFS